MEGITTTPQQPESKVNNAERVILLERENRFREADHLIETIRFETNEIGHRDEMLVALSEIGIHTISEDSNLGGEVGAEEVIKPSFANIDDIEENIELLKTLGSEFGYDQRSQTGILKDIITQIRLSRDEDEIRKLTLQAKNIFSTNITGLLNKHYDIANEQQDLGELCIKNGRQLQSNLNDNFSGETWRKINEGRVGLYVKRSVKYGKDEKELVDGSEKAHDRFASKLRTFNDKFSQEMDSLAPKE